LDLAGPGVGDHRIGNHRCGGDGAQGVFAGHDVVEHVKRVGVDGGEEGNEGSHPGVDHPGAPLSSAPQPAFAVEHLLH
jgi:hypothetical protein